MIIQSQISDAKILTEIALKSKAFWKYPPELIASWKEELTVSKKMIEDMIVYKFLQNKEPVGFYILNQPKETTIELEFLFVLPDFIGKGIGKQLINHAFQKAKEFCVKSITLIADPNAVPFYYSFDFVEVGKIESTIFNRFLPVLKKELV